MAGVAIVYLVFDPGQLFEAGFQLSFLAAAAIAALAVPSVEASSLPFSGALTGITESSRDPKMPPEAAQFRVELRLLAETLACWLKIPAGWLVRVLAFLARLALYAYEMAVISTAIQIGLAAADGILLSSHLAIRILGECAGCSVAWVGSSHRLRRDLHRLAFRGDAGRVAARRGAEEAGGLASAV